MNAAEFIRLCQKGSYKDVRLALTNGDFEIKHINEASGGHTALMIAVMVKQDEALTELLLSIGAEIDQKVGKMNQTVLHTAAMFCSNRKVIELLIENGADINAKDSSGATPLDLADGYGNTNAGMAIAKAGGKRNKNVV
jgi:ankyrin repeat protein